MSLTKDINERLDEILAIRSEIKKMDYDLEDDASLKNIQTGEQINKKQALRAVEEMVDRVKFDLNKLTNNGKNVKGLFTNNYYVNDLMQDKQIVKQEERSKPTCGDEDVEYFPWQG
jgi:NifU-like protein involved in Fe-S cluster formation